LLSFFVPGKAFPFGVRCWLATFHLRVQSQSRSSFRRHFRSTAGSSATEAFESVALTLINPGSFLNLSQWILAKDVHTFVRTQAVSERQDFTPCPIADFTLQKSIQILRVFFRKQALTSINFPLHLLLSGMEFILMQPQKLEN
jgi:hypothetical protein